MAAQTNEIRAMIAALAGSQALLLDALRRRGSISQEDIDYILAVTEQGIAKAVGTDGPKAVVEMMRLCLQQLAAPESGPANTAFFEPIRTKTRLVGNSSYVGGESRRS